MPRDQIRKWSEPNMLILLGMFMTLITFTEELCLCKVLSGIHHSIDLKTGAFIAQGDLEN
jgi:hypothetical protein